MGITRSGKLKKRLTGGSIPIHQKKRKFEMGRQSANTKLGEKKVEEWPIIDEKQIKNQKIKIAIQINGKTKEIIEIKKDLSEKDAINQSKTNDKVKKSIVGKKIIKTIFVKNKIINYLLK